MIRVRTPGRLHFGLLSIPSANAPERRSYGGIGLMVECAGVDLTVRCADTMSADGPLAERALQVARTYCASAGVSQAFHIQIASAASEHTGLGIGTQLSLAVAHGIASLTNQSESAPNLAHRVGRGARSAIGVHGFERGGFLVEGGKTPDQAVSPLLARYEFPADWDILLIVPRDLQGAHGVQERKAFAELQSRERDDRLTDAMSRLIVLGILPALIEHDLAAFGESLYEYNRRAGEMFRSVQSAVYAHPFIDATVKAMRDMGIHGVGQSSWGPTVFGIVERDDDLVLRNRLSKMFENALVVAGSACNRGAFVSRESA
jgi:beta-RFAP synthase